jgi:hypothetical protein
LNAKSKRDADSVQVPDDVISERFRQQSRPRSQYTGLLGASDISLVGQSENASDIAKTRETAHENQIGRCLRDSQPICDSIPNEFPSLFASAPNV